MSEIVKEINGTKYGFKFTNLTLIRYCERRGIDLSDFDKDVEKNFLLSNSVMMQCAYEVYNKGEQSLTDYEIDDLLTAMSDEDHREVFACYSTSITSMVAKFLPVSGSKKK